MTRAPLHYFVQPLLPVFTFSALHPIAWFQQTKSPEGTQIRLHWRMFALAEDQGFSGGCFARAFQGGFKEQAMSTKCKGCGLCRKSEQEPWVLHLSFCFYPEILNEHALTPGPLENNTSFPEYEDRHNPVFFKESSLVATQASGFLCLGIDSAHILDKGEQKACRSVSGSALGHAWVCWVASLHCESAWWQHATFLLHGLDFFFNFFFLRVMYLVLCFLWFLEKWYLQIESSSCAGSTGDNGY